MGDCRRENSQCAEGNISINYLGCKLAAAHNPRLTKAWSRYAGARGACPACVPCMLSCSGVQVPCPGVRGEGQVKRQGVTARWGLKEAWSEGAGRGTRTGSEVWYSRDERARDSTALRLQWTVLDQSGAYARKVGPLTAGELRGVLAWGCGRRNPP